MSQYFPKLYELYGLDLLSYPTKVDLKEAKVVDTFNLAAKLDLASLKSGLGKKDIGKLKTIPADLSRLNKVVDDEMLITKQKLKRLKTRN